MIKVVLAVAKPKKATPPPPVNEIRYYNFTVIQTASDFASVLVADDLNQQDTPYQKVVAERQP